MAVAVIGSINVDLVASVRRLPAPGETVPGKSFATAPGGKGANQALAAARAGSPTRMIGAVGKDAFAAEALSLLAAECVDLSGIREAAAATGIALILVDAGGENVIAVVAGANDAVLPGDLPLGSPAIGLGHGIEDRTESAQHRSGMPDFGGVLGGEGGADLQGAHRILSWSGPKGPHTFV